MTSGAATLLRPADRGGEEPEGIFSFEIIDPVPVHVGDGGLQANDG